MSVVAFASGERGCRCKCVVDGLCEDGVGANWGPSRGAVLGHVCLQGPVGLWLTLPVPPFLPA